MELLIIAFLILVLSKASVRRREGPPGKGIEIKRIHRSTSYAARRGRDVAHGKKPVNWNDDGWGW